jgi:hypothetical protein
MTWNGLKRVAFVPVHRSNAFPPDNPVPTDWAAEILARVLYDPGTASGADRSLRTYIHAASSGRADLDAVVLPMRTIDEQDVPPDRFEDELGGRLRDQGFDAAALVMLGGPQTGTAQRGGFWARFAMVEGVGIWAMELIHCLTAFDDLYPFGGNMGAYDEMASSGGTHPSAYTKAAIGWLDPSAVAQHTGLAATYDLHTVGLVQPPPSGRSTAARIGSQVPYLMVESRAKVDQFDQNIPAEGVIVYRVQTTSPHGTTQDSKAPVALLTVTPNNDATALPAGGSFTAGNGVSVQVLAAIPGGFRVRVLDPSNHLVDRSGEHHAPDAAGRPTGLVVPAQGVHDIAYRDEDGHLHELWRDAQGGTGTTDLTANAGAPAAAGSPFFYNNPATPQAILLYRGKDGKVRSLYWDFGAVGVDDLSGTAGAPKAAGDPVGYHHAAHDTHHVVYASADGHLHELFWVGLAPVQHGGDLTAAASAPQAVGRPSAFVDGSGTHIVIYRDPDGVVRDLSWSTGAVAGEGLSDFAGTPTAKGDPVAYYTAHDDTHQVAYVGADGHVWELFWPDVAPVVGWDLSAAAGAPPATGNAAAYYQEGTHTKHVIYRSDDDRLHELWWVPGGGTPAHVDLTAAYGLPSAADDPAAFTVEGPNTQHVVFRGTDGHLYEVVW